MKKLSLPETAAQDPAYRLLMEKRCEVYARTAGLLMEVEEALSAEDHDRAGTLLEDVRRALRSALAFLTDEVYEELENVEALADAVHGSGHATPTGIAQDAGEKLRDALTLLHVKLARSLGLPGQDLADIVALPARLKRKLEDGKKSLEEKQKRRALEERSWNYEAVARELIGAKQYKQAVKHLKQAIRLDPDRAVFRNDLGVVYGLLGLHEEAAQEYRAAVTLNEKHKDRRTDEWTTSYYNLGVALRKLAQEHDAPKQMEKRLALIREARAAFEEYVKVTPGGPKLGVARAAGKQLADDALILETRIREAKEAAEAEAESAGWRRRAFDE